MDETESSENQNVPDHIRDIETLTRTALKEKYKSTYSSWRNRKSSAAPSGNWSPEFDQFADFLRHMGPRPSPRHTLDRIDNANLMYAPDLCRWAGKRTQANNRWTTLHVTHEGRSRPLSEVAREIGQLPGTVRKRLDRGRSEEEAVAGTRFSESMSFGKDPRRYKPWPKPEDPMAQHYWETRYLDAGGARACTRYEFLIRTLQREVEKLGEWVYDHRESNNPKIVAIYDQQAGLLEKCRAALKDAQEEVVYWNRATARYEAKIHEERALRSGSFRDYHGDNDDFD